MKFQYFSKICPKIQGSSKTNKNNWYLPQRPIHIYGVGDEYNVTLTYDIHIASYEKYHFAF
jgi:hypothetical protein